MKIYPGTHLIYNVETVNTDEDIALGYLDSEFVEESINININDEYNINSIKEVLPYSALDTLELTLYDNNNLALNIEEQEQLLIRQETGKYMYKPKASVVFEPYTFNYKVLAKKDMKYSSSRKYNIKAACDSESLAKTMIQFFSDSYERNLCPTNIKFNNGDRKIESLLNSSFEEIDFLFINSTDGELLSNEEDVPIDELINNNVVPWIICDKLPGQDDVDYKTQEELEFEINKNEVINTKIFTTKYYFKLPQVKDGEKYHTVFKYYRDKSPIIIKELVNKGFVVYCNSEFLSRIDQASDLFYEIIMYIYLRAYVSTQTITEWITDIMPDYIVQNGRLTQKEKFTSHMELHKLLGLREGDANPIEVKIEPPLGQDTSIVYYTGMSSNYLVFKKIADTEYADPIKESHQISIFTERKNIMFYDSFVYDVRESISDKIECTIENSELNVVVQPFKNTKLDTRNFLYPKSASIEINKDIATQNISLVWDINKKTIDLTDKKLLDNHVLLATIKIKKVKSDSKLYDMRKRGGGLPEGKDNFDCLDIGNIMGRPYRKGGALITSIKIPKKYEYKKDTIYEIIYNTIRKHMIADDYLVLNLEFE